MNNCNYLCKQLYCVLFLNFNAIKILFETTYANVFVICSFVMNNIKLTKFKFFQIVIYSSDY